MHSWNLSPKEAIEVQKDLRAQVRLTPLSHAPRTVGGADVSMNRFAKDGYAGFVTLSYPGLSILDTATTHGAIPFPYVPGLLSFREIPILLLAWEKLRLKPDVLMVDGTGIAHPRRLGIATHIGLLLNVPTIGVAKSVLVGSYEEPPHLPGAHTPLVYKGEIVGAALRTRAHVRPVFVSPGHLITHEEAITLVSTCVLRHRIPEPTRNAHLLVNEARKGGETSFPVHPPPHTVSSRAVG